MTDHDVHGCGRIGSRIGVLCAALGLAAAIAMLKAMEIDGLLDPRILLGPVGFGVLALFAAAAFLGNKTGTFLCKRGNRTLLNAAGGLFVAFGSIMVAVSVGSWLSFIAISTVEGASLDRLFGYIFITPILIGWFGGIPAIILGVLYGCLVKWRLLKLTR